MLCQLYFDITPLLVTMLCELYFDITPFISLGLCATNVFQSICKTCV